MAYHPLKLDPAVVRHAALSLEAAQRLEDPMAAMETVEGLIRYLQRPAATQPVTAPVAPPEPAPPVRAITPAQRRRRCAGAARARARRAAGAGA